MNLFASIRTKFIVVFLAVLSPIIFLLYYNNYYAMKLVESKVTSSYQSALSSFVKQSDNVMNEAEKFLINVRQQELELSELDFNEFSDDTSYELVKLSVFNVLNNNLDYMKDIDSFMLYSMKTNEVVIATQNAQTYEQKMEAATHLMNAYEKKQTLPAGGKVSSVLTQVGGKYYLVRLYAASDTQILGAWFDLEHFTDLLNANYSAIWASDGKLLTNRGLISRQTDWVGRSIKQGRLPVQERTSDFLLLSQTSASKDLKYVILIPEKEILMNLTFFQKVIRLTPAAILVLILLYMGFMYRSLIKPMHYLISGMRKLSLGNLDTRLAVKASIEFNYMNQSFNSMAEEIKSLKLNIYEEQLRVQKAEMKQLQMQINPHFYANSLNIINGFAQLKDYGSVQEMTRMLAAYFRFVTSSNRPQITLREEIEHIQNYLQIQMYRYPSTLVFDMDIPHDLESLPLPPLTLQPFVENAIIHGYQKKLNPFIIKLQANKATIDHIKVIQIAVEDNGIGASPEKLELLKRAATDLNMDQAHLGVWNVERRLRLIYGEEAIRMMFENREEGGFRVTLTIPEK